MAQDSMVLVKDETGQVFEVSKFLYDFTERFFNLSAERREGFIALARDAFGKDSSESGREALNFMESLYAAAAQGYKFNVKVLREGERRGA